MCRIADLSIIFNKRLLRVFAVFCLALANSSFAAESRLIAYAESSSVDSQVVLGEDGPYVAGYASDLLRAVLSEAGFSADIRVVPWPRLMRSLASERNVLALNMTRTPSREDQFEWIGEIRPVSFKLWGLRARAAEFPRTLETARNLRIAAYHNDVVEQYLLNQGFSNLVYVTENYNILNMLRRSRIDLIPFSQIAMEDFLSNSGTAGDELLPIIDLDEISTAHYLVMSKDSDPALVEELTSAYQSLVDNGSYAQILGDSLRTRTR